jgi:cytoskeleton protein RodZ
MPDLPPIQESGQDDPPSPGALLRKARQGYEWSIDDVAANLNLSIDVVSALERDDYRHLPGATFVRGYLRSYARLLGIDENEVLVSTSDSSQRRVHLGSVVPVMDGSAFKRKKLLVILVITAWWLSGLRPFGLGDRSVEETAAEGDAPATSSQQITLPIRSSGSNESKE